MTAATTIKAALEARRIKEADFRFALYVEPAGKGLHRVRLLGSSTLILVKSAVGSITFAPNELVSVGNHSGSTRYVLLGAASPGSAGSSAFPPGATVSFGADSVLITAVWPGEVAPGVTVDVDVFGYGFRVAEDSWEVVILPAGDVLEPFALDPAATILSVSALDAVAEGYTLGPGQLAVRISLEVAAAAPDGHGLTFRVQRDTAVNVAPDLVIVKIPAVPPPPDHYGFTADATESKLAVERYLGGAFVERFVAIDTPYSIESTPEAAIPIRTSGAVGAESVAWRAGGPGSSEDPRIHVIDSSDGSLKTWNPTAGFSSTPPVLALDGRLWWVEFELAATNPCSIRIWSSPADLVSPTEELSTTLPNVGLDAHGVICPRITEDHIYFGWTLFSEGVDYTDYQFPLAGGSLVDRTADWDAGHDGIGLGSNPRETNVGAHGVLAGEGNGCSYVLGSTVWHQALDGSPPVLAFPISEAWPLSGELSIDWLAGVGTLVYCSANLQALRGPLTAGEFETPLEIINLSGAGVEFPDAFFFRSP